MSVGEDFLQLVSDEELIARVQAFAWHFAPEAVCEFKDYRHKIGLGALDANGTLQEVRFLRQDLSPDRVEISARILQKKLDDGIQSVGAE